jgi:hypothetical protein
MTQGQTRSGRRALALAPVVPAPRAPRAPYVSFCGHCGDRPEPSDTPSLRSRVCAACGFGVLLECAADVAPAPGQAFLVLDSSMSVCAVSSGAESLLATRETEAINRHITELLVPADAETDTRHNLAVAITWAARGTEGTHRVFVRPANTFGVRLGARIAGCGPPQAALLVFESPRR